MAYRTCIKGGFHDVHTLFHIVVHGVHVRCLVKCLLGIFSLVWTPMSTKLWGFSCFLIRNMFGSLVVYLTHFAPHCIFYALVMHYTLPPFAHTFATLVMHLSIPYFFILACHVYLMLCSTLFCLRIELHFLIHLHPSCIISIVRSFISYPHFSLTLCLFLTKRGRVYSRKYTEEFLSFLYDSCVHP